jgi:hypothetical protein
MKDVPAARRLTRITMPPKAKKKSKPKPVIEPVYVPIFADIDDEEGSEFERMTRTDCRSLMAPCVTTWNSTLYSAAS